MSVIIIYAPFKRQNWSYWTFKIQYIIIINNTFQYKKQKAENRKMEKYNMQPLNKKGD